MLVSIEFCENTISTAEDRRASSSSNFSLFGEGGKTFDFPSQIQSLLRKKIEEEKKYEKVAQVFASFCNIFVKFLCK